MNQRAQGTRKNERLVTVDAVLASHLLLTYQRGQLRMRLVMGLQSIRPIVNQGPATLS